MPNKYEAEFIAFTGKNIAEALKNDEEPLFMVTKRGNALNVHVAQSVSQDYVKQLIRALASTANIEVVNKI